MDETSKAPGPLKAAPAMPPPGETGSTPEAFGTGMGYTWRGVRFLAGHPRLWAWAAFPFVLSLVFYALVLYFGWSWVGEWIDSTFADREGMWRGVEYLLIGVFWILALVLVAFAFVPFAALISSPFNDLLSEKVEKLYLGASVDEPFTLKNLIRALVVGLRGEILRFATLSGLLIFAFCFNFIPVFGQMIAGGLSTFFTIRYLSLEFTSFSMDRRYYDWRGKQDYLRRFRARSMGFGTMAFLVMLVPLVNALFIPVSAVAGTLLFCDTELEK